MMRRARSSALRTPFALSQRERRASPSLRAGRSGHLSHRQQRALLLEVQRPLQSGEHAREERPEPNDAAGIILAQAAPVRDEDPQLGKTLVYEAHLGKLPPPEPELIGDYLGVAGVALALTSYVGLPGAVYRNARNTEHSLPTIQQERFQKRRRPARQVEPDHTRTGSAQLLDLREGGFDVCLGGIHSPREESLSLLVEDANPVECLAHVEPHPEPAHCACLLVLVSSRRRPQGSPPVFPYVAIWSRSS